MEQPQHARQRRFPRNGGQGEIRFPFFWSSATEGVPGKPFPVPHRGCPEDWGFDIARPRQRIALLGRKKARKFLNTRDSAGSPVMGVRGKYEGPIRDHKKATAMRWLFCGPNRDYQGHYPIFFSIKCLSLLSGRTIDSLPTNRRQFTANIADKDHPDKGPHNIS